LLRWDWSWVGNFGNSSSPLSALTLALLFFFGEKRSGYVLEIGDTYIDGRLGKRMNGNVNGNWDWDNATAAAAGTW
jgi:hypothetical protein